MCSHFIEFQEKEILKAHFTAVSGKYPNYK